MATSPTYEPINEEPGEDSKKTLLVIIMISVLIFGLGFVIHSYSSFKSTLEEINSIPSETPAQTIPANMSNQNTTTTSVAESTPVTTLEYNNEYERYINQVLAISKQTPLEILFDMVGITLSSFLI